MKKRLTAAFIAILLTSVSCAGNRTSVQTDTQKTEVPETTEQTNPFESMETANFDGRTFTILDANQYPDLHINIPGEEINGEVVNDALFERGLTVGQRFNTVIEYVQMTPSDKGIQTLKSSVLAGDDDYQLCISTIRGGSGGSLGTIATEGLLANLADMDSLNLDKPWWSRLMYENLCLNDKMYFTSGDISPAMYNMAACVYLNKKLLGDYGITTDYYQMVRDGKWTIDELISLAKDKDRDLNDNGVMHTNDDFFGFIHQPNDTTISMMMIGCGLKLSDLSDGKIEINLNSQHAYDVYEKISELKRIVKFDQQDDTIKKAFFNDRALSMLHLVDSTVMLRPMESDFSVLPVPKYDTEQAEYYSLCNPWCDAFSAIPITADPEFAGMITEALARYSYTNIRPKVLELNLKQKALRDEESIEMLDIIYDSTYLDFNSCYVFGGLTEKLADAIMKDKPVASVVESLLPAADADAEKLVEEAFSK